MIPLYLFHVTSVEHNESTLWTFIICNIFVVLSGIVFMYRLFTQKSVKAAGIAFGVAILINYILIAIFGDFWDLLG
ncbi:MAG: hypothetical protein ABGX20_17885 [Bacillus sp. (in: firmicutes)]